MSASSDTLHFVMRPRAPGSGSFTTTIRRPASGCLKPWVAALDCSTSMATAGSTSTPSREDRFPVMPARHPLPQRDRLFRNRGDGTFEDVTERTGLASMPGGYGHGVTVGDYDNDGRPDLFVTRWRSYALYHNKGDGTFEDVTDQAGLGGSRDWPTSAAFADLDGDGDLDLYVCHYAAWDPQTSGPCPHASEKGRFMYCGPRTFDAMPDHLFRNDGGRFTDVSDQAGITAADREGRGLGVVAADLDEDGRVDLFVANDLTANYLFHNEGGSSVPRDRRGSRCRHQRRRWLSGRHGRRLRRPRRRRPGRSGGHQFLSGNRQPSTGTLEAASSSTALPRWGWPRQAAICSVLEPASWTSTTTASSTWPQRTATSTI